MSARGRGARRDRATKSQAKEKPAMGISGLKHLELL